MNFAVACLKSQIAYLEGVSTIMSVALGSGQYRNAVASGRRLDVTSLRLCETDPTLPRYGTDPTQVQCPDDTDPTNNDFGL